MLKRCMVIIFIISIFCSFGLLGRVALADSQSNVPLNLNVSQTDGSFDIGYDSNDGCYYVNIEWDAVPEWSEDDSTTNYYSIYTSEDGVNYTWTADVPGSETSYQIRKHGSQNLKAGKIYYCYITAKHIHKDSETGVETTHESSASNTILFMTKIDIDVVTSASNSITIKWDDVRLGTGRINYDLYISENKDFSQTSPLNIRQDNIGDDKPVKPVPAENKLTYTRSGLKMGTIYYVKIRPIVADPRVRFLPQTDTACGYTYIIARILRISDDFWRIEWNPITSGAIGSEEEIDYFIRRGDLSQGDNPIEDTLGQTRDTQLPVRVTGDQFYYRIVAYVETQTGELLEVRSDRIMAIESEISSVPPVPDIRDVINGSPEFDYKDALKPTEVTIAWMAPKTVDGDLDTEIVYDIWLTPDADSLDGTNGAAPIEREYVVPEADYIREPGKLSNVIAYKYNITNLIPNTPYYFKIIAKKIYTTVDQDGLIVNKYFSSQPSYKVVITPVSGDIEDPVTPSKPPLKVKISNQTNQEMVGTDWVTITWKNDWYEKWDVSDSENPKWVYVENPAGIDESVLGSVYRRITYGSDITFEIGYAEYNEEFDFDEMGGLPMQIAGIRNTSSRDQEYTIRGLTPNTRYVIWMKAARTEDLISGPSDPLIIVTAPEIDLGDEKPVVPVFNYSYAGDTFVELWWSVKEGYSYNIKYSTKDDPGSASNTVSISPQELNGINAYKISDLTSDTVYYFWIQAETNGGGGGTNQSDWSDSYAVKTVMFIPPDAPRGFGIKNTPDGIGRYHITFEWLVQPGLEYILEVSDNADFKNSTEYQAQSLTEFKIENLMPNHRYYARLYSYDPVKEMRSSGYAGVVAVNTLRSTDEYDSDINLNEPVDEEFHEEGISKYIWNYSITDENTDKFIQYLNKNNIVDYKIDLAESSKKVKTRIVSISQRAFNALEKEKRNIIIDADEYSIVLRAGIFNVDTVRNLLSRNSDVTIRMNFSEAPASSVSTKDNQSYKTKVMALDFIAVTSGNELPIKKFNKPLKISMLFADNLLSSPGSYSGSIYDDENAEWINYETEVFYDKDTREGEALFEIDRPGKVAVLKTGGRIFNDISDRSIKTAIENISLKHDLKSVEGNSFRPAAPITVKEAIKLMFDSLDYKYNGNDTEAAAKAGITRHVRTSDLNAECTRQEVLTMLARVYEIKTGKRALGDNSIPQYKDGYKVAKNVVPVISFMIEKGIAIGKSATELAPDEAVSRGDVIKMLEKTLAAAGEL